LTLDFIETDEHFPIHYYYFRAGQEKFNSILARSSNVDSVFITGRALKRDGRVVDVDIERR
jgi:hypothetical protein